MYRFTGRKSVKTGLGPGSLVYTGEQGRERVKLCLTRYDSAGAEEDGAEADEADLEGLLARMSGDKVNWLNIDGVHRVDLVKRLAEDLALHPLTAEDIMSIGQRPKLEVFDHYVFIVLQMLSLGADGRVESEQLSLIVGKDYVISLQERPGDVFAPLRKRIRARGRICQLGADYLAYALLDVIVDNYFVVLEAIGERIEEVEDELLDDASSDTLQAITMLKREMLFLRKAVWPLREIISTLEREESPLFSPPILTYLRDVYDHTVQAIDTVETLRDLTANLLDLYLSGLSFKMNEVMKVLTVIATIFIPLTFIVGVYGMNFEYMPELGWRWGYPMVWLVMLLVSGGMLLYFRRKKWF